MSLKEARKKAQRAVQRWYQEYSPDIALPELRLLKTTVDEAVRRLENRRPTVTVIQPQNQDQQTCIE